MNELLKEIIANKRFEISKSKERIAPESIREKAAAAPSPRNFLAALSNARGARIIAECKKQSPSKGIMKEDYNPVLLAKSYERGGAAAISVLTDHRYFGGTLADLVAVKAAVTIPVLRKDFIVDEYQIFEARAAGADTFLLIAGTVPYPELFRLIEIGQAMGMEPLIESHTAEELEKSLAGPGKIYGINNRNLNTFKVDLRHSEELIQNARTKRRDIIMVCESGIRGADDIKSMGAAGFHVFLVGESLITSPDPEHLLKTMTSSIG